VNKKPWTVGMMIPLAVATMVATAPAASAVKVPPTVANGQCSAGSLWTITAKPDNGRMEIEFQVNSNRIGESWTVRITDNGELVSEATPVTLAPSGSFTVRTITADRAGVDHFVGVARNTGTDETCTAQVDR
jgi:hypothetical protein